MAAKRQGESGPPKWTYVIAALVTVGGLGWTVASHFIPKPEPAPASVATKPDAGTSVRIDGTNNVGVGKMEGGTIVVGPTGAKPAP